MQRSDWFAVLVAVFVLGAGAYLSTYSAEVIRAVGIALMAASLWGLIIWFLWEWRRKAVPSILLAAGITFALLAAGSFAGWVFLSKLKMSNAGETAPDVTLRFIYPEMPALVLVNVSNKVAREIKWSVAIWNIDDPRAYLNPGAAPNAHDPLPIPVSTFDFLRPRTASGPQTLFNSPAILPHVKQGQRLAGSASVICPECGRGRSYLVHILFGEGGWYTEVLDKQEGVGWSSGASSAIGQNAL
jgi:hypothetical protein